MTRNKPDLDLQGVPREDVETVSVPRALVDEMSKAIAAMQTLAADGMLGVAKGLGLVAYRPPKHAGPPCDHCGIEVAVGLAHAEACTSDEAVRYRQTEIITLEG